jgi:hypothetical protein
VVLLLDERAQALDGDDLAFRVAHLNACDAELLGVVLSCLHDFEACLGDADLHRAPASGVSVALHIAVVEIAHLLLAELPRRERDNPRPTPSAGASTAAAGSAAPIAAVVALLLAGVAVALAASAAAWRNRQYDFAGRADQGLRWYRLGRPVDLGDHLEAAIVDKVGVFPALALGAGVEADDEGDLGRV